MFLKNNIELDPVELVPFLYDANSQNACWSEMQDFPVQVSNEVMLWIVDCGCFYD